MKSQYRYIGLGGAASIYCGPKFVYLFIIPMYK